MSSLDSSDDEAVLADVWYPAPPVYVRPPAALSTTPRSLRTCISHTADAVRISRETDPPANKRTFTFDQVFSVDARQDEVADATTPLVDGFLDGFNATVLTGQTGSGKTYTLGSNYTATLQEEAQGVIPRVAKSQADSKVENVVKVAFLEIYQEQVRDLLVPETDHKDIAIRDKNGVITVTGIHEEVVSSAAEMLSCLEFGSTARTTGDTQVHMHSSRSHAIFTITLEQRVDLSQLDGGEGDVENVETVKGEGRRRRSAVWKSSKLHLVDLAGSERLKRTGAEGVRFKESIKINSGLLALGNVISILGDEKRNQPGTPSSAERWAPYRDSKLTRLLQDSLGGNAKTLMIACISPLEDDMEESLNTLKYANRARNIQNKPVMNSVDLTATRLADMQQKIDLLEAEAEDRRNQETEEQETKGMNLQALHEMDNDQWMQFIVDEVRSRTLKATDAVKDLESVRKEKSELEERVMELEQLLAESRSTVTDLESRLEIAEGELRPIRQHAMEMEEDLNLVMNALCAMGRRKGGDGTMDKGWGVVEKYRGESAVVDAAVSDQPESYLPRLVTPSTATSNPASSSKPTTFNSVARSQRRKSLKSRPSTDTLADHAATVKRLEDDLFTSCKALEACRKELEDARGRVEEWEGVVRDKEVLLQRLESVNTDLIVENDALKEDLDKLREEVTAYFDAKASLVDGEAQTDEGGEQDVVESESSKGEDGGDEEYPVHFSLDRGNHEDGDDDTEESDEKDAASRPDSAMSQKLDHANKARVELVKELHKAHKAAEKMKQHYADVIQRLEREVEGWEREVAKMKGEVGEKEAMKEKLREEYERKLRNLEGQITKLKQKHKEHEKLSIAKEGLERKVVELQAEVEKVAGVASGLRKKMKEDAEKSSELDTRRTKELQAMRKQHEEDAKKLRGLEGVVEGLKKKLDRKSEEVVGLREKVGGKGGVVGVGIAGRRRRSVAESEKSDHGGRSNEHEVGDGQEKDVEERRGHETPLRRDEGRKGNDFRKAMSAPVMRTDSSDDAGSVRVENFRKYHALSKQHREVRHAVHAIDREIAEVEHMVEELDVEDAASEELQARLMRLMEDRERVKAEAEWVRGEKMRAEARLNADDEGQRPEPGGDNGVGDGEVERIDWDAVGKAFEGDEEVWKVINDLKTTPTQTPTHILSHLLQQLLTLRKELKSVTFRAAGQDVDLPRVKEVVQVYEERMQALREEYEARLCLVELNAGVAVGELVEEERMAERRRRNGKGKGGEVMRITGIEDVGVQTDSVSEGSGNEDLGVAKGKIQELEKDLYYYRKTSRELKNKLREVVGVNHRLAGVLREKGWEGVVERSKVETAQGGGGKAVAVG
ncbi:hypothetical protein HDV00_003979 [Rhizophlyctis rosea]|nr:hypothetical protein HDV00_003979 [Rhizophlyctis rosea]